MQHTLQTQIMPIDLDSGTYYISLMTYDIVGLERADSTRLIGETYMRLAQDLAAQPNSDQQRSACVITDFTPVADQITPEVMQTWFAEAEKNDIQTQKQLFQLFQRPVFMITVLSGFSEDYLNDSSLTVSADANRTYVTGTLEEAMELARKLLNVAHPARR